MSKLDILKKARGGNKEEQSGPKIDNFEDMNFFKIVDDEPEPTIMKDIEEAKEIKEAMNTSLEFLEDDVMEEENNEIEDGTFINQDEEISEDIDQNERNDNSTLMDDIFNNEDDTSGDILLSEETEDENAITEEEDEETPEESNGGIEVEEQPVVEDKVPINKTQLKKETKREEKQAMNGITDIEKKIILFVLGKSKSENINYENPFFTNEEIYGVIDKFIESLK